MARTSGRKWRVLVLHGPNLNMLGSRERELYGQITLEAIDLFLAGTASRYGAKVESKQSNHEGVLVDWVQQASGKYDGIVINPGGYGHTSVTLRDAIASVPLPTVEVHLTNIYAREEFRRTSMIAPECVGVIAGFGAHSYTLGFRALLDYLKSRQDDETQT